MVSHLQYYVATYWEWLHLLDGFIPSVVIAITFPITNQAIVAVLFSHPIKFVIWSVYLLSTITYAVLLLRPCNIF